MSDQARTILPVAAQRSPNSYVANARFLFRKNRNTIFTALLTIIVFVIVVTLNSGSFLPRKPAAPDRKLTRRQLGLDLPPPFVHDQIRLKWSFVGRKASLRPQIDCPFASP